MLTQSSALGRSAGQGREQPNASNDSLRGRAVRFVIAGVAMSIFYPALTALLVVSGVPFQAALIFSFLAAVVLHFTLQRVFVWSQPGEYALPLRQQSSEFFCAPGGPQKSNRKSRRRYAP